MAKKSKNPKMDDEDPRKLKVSVRSAVIGICAVLVGLGAGGLGWAAGHGVAAAVLEGVGAAAATVYFLDRFID